MTECCPRYVELAREYVQNAKVRTWQKEPWDSLIYGVALTMAYDTKWHTDVIKALKESFPSVASARGKCEGGDLPYANSALQHCWSPDEIRRAMCENASEKPILTKTGKTKRGLLGRP